MDRGTYKGHKQFSVWLASLAFHLVAVFCAVRWSQSTSLEQKYSEPLALDFPVEVISPPPPSLTKRNQVVDSKSGKESDLVPEDAYLGEKNRVVRIQRSAEVQQKERIPKPSVAKNQNTEPQPKVVLGFDWTRSLSKQRETASKKNTANGKDTASAAAREYVQGLPQGAEEALSTREFVYFTYFQRMRDQLGQAWRPLVRSYVSTIYRKGRRLAGETEYTTQTLFTLNSEGEIVRIQVIDESGAHDLDSAAVDSLNQAGPFPNPPRGLLGQNKEIQIRWDFVLKT